MRLSRIPSAAPVYTDCPLWLFQSVSIYCCHPWFAVENKFASVSTPAYHCSRLSTNSSVSQCQRIPNPTESHHMSACACDYAETVFASQSNRGRRSTHCQNNSTYFRPPSNSNDSNCDMFAMHCWLWCCSPRRLDPGFCIYRLVSMTAAMALSVRWCYRSTLTADQCCWRLMWPHRFWFCPRHHCNSHCTMMLFVSSATFSAASWRRTPSHRCRSIVLCAWSTSTAPVALDQLAPLLPSNPVRFFSISLASVTAYRSVWLAFAAPSASHRLSTWVWASQEMHDPCAGNAWANPHDCCTSTHRCRIWIKCRTSWYDGAAATGWQTFSHIYHSCILWRRAPSENVVANISYWQRMPERVFWLRHSDCICSWFPDKNSAL